MLRAWRLHHLARRMREEVVCFTYQKNDGSIRCALGTLMQLPETFGMRKCGKPSYKTMTYFDIEKRAFRCFRIENLMSVAG